ncbi:MFS transporter [Bacillus salitolerans]|uniref:MFS transporter n=1 Tax=Bacillus salitolerans TaxID=1437434 RepID=A0ABW4LS81_9BACI
MFKLFKNRDFLCLFSGRFITNLGDSIYSVAAMWLVYELTKSSFYTGIAGALILLPSIFEFLVGPLVDRWKLKSILVNTQISQALLISIIPIGYFLDFLNVWLVIVVMFLVTCIEQFVYPAQNAALPKILDKEELVAGNSLMTFAYQGTDLVFIGLSGLIISLIGVINVYIIDVFTFLAATIIFRLIKFQTNTQDERDNTELGTEKIIKNSFKSYLSELNEGKNYVINSIIPKILIPITVVNFIFGMITAIMPEHSFNVGGELYYGYFLAIMSVAMLLGTLLANLFSEKPLGIMTISSFFLASVFWFGSFLIKTPVLSLMLFGLAFIPISLINVLIVSTLQGIIPENLLGRVFAWYSSIAALFVPLGSFVGGVASSMTEVANIYGLGGLGLLIISLYWMFYPLLRRIPSPTKINPKEYGFHTGKDLQA